MRHFWPLILFLIILMVAIVGLKQAPLAEKSLQLAPQRIITLSPSITEIAFALGLDEEVVAVTKYCDYPKKVTVLPNVGGYIDPNLEAIVALQPDLVILVATQQHTIKQLQQLNIPILAIYNSSLSDIKNSILTIGKATNRQQRAQEILNDIDFNITAITTKVAHLPRPKVMLAMGHSTASEQMKNVYISGQHDFYNDLIHLAGGQNSYQGTHLKVPSLSIEGIMQLNPDVIIDVFPEASDHNSDLEQVKQRWQNLVYVNAVKHNRVHIIEENYATIPGPRVFQLLDKMAKIIHPDINWDEQSL